MKKINLVKVYREKVKPELLEKEQKAMEKAIALQLKERLP